MQKDTGLKWKYILFSLPYHCKVQQMYTLADLLSRILDILTGKLSTQKVKACVRSFGRFDVFDFSFHSRFFHSHMLTSPLPVKDIYSALIASEL